MVDVEQRPEIGGVTVGQQQAIARDDVDEALKGSLNFGEVPKNVGVSKLEVVDDYCLGQVMDKLAAFVEEGGVVLAGAAR